MPEFGAYPPARELLQHSSHSVLQQGAQGASQAGHNHCPLSISGVHVLIACTRTLQGGTERRHMSDITYFVSLNLGEAHIKDGEDGRFAQLNDQVA